MSKQLPLTGSAPPPVKERPKCPWCGKHRKPRYQPVNAEGVKLGQPPWTHRVWDGYVGEAPFCSAKCAITWAKGVWVMADTREADHFPLARLHNLVPLDPDASGKLRKDKR